MEDAGVVLPVAVGGTGSSPPPARDRASNAPDASTQRVGPGEACGRDDECTTLHCDTVCCAAGACCRTNRDCSSATNGGAVGSCNEPKMCQGTASTTTCTAEFRCASVDAPDDRACDSKIEANDCGPYPSVFCTGAVDQAVPKCATACGSDRECDPGAHCAGSACAPDVGNGDRCTKDGDCVSQHCNAGICCKGGDCCKTVSDCPASYSREARCENPQMCMGTRKDPVCTDFQCSSTTVDDDSRCTDTVLADRCGRFADVYCDGTASQNPVCPSFCTSDEQCDPSAHCRVVARIFGVCTDQESNSESSGSQ